MTQKKQLPLPGSENWPEVTEERALRHKKIRERAEERKGCGIKLAAYGTCSEDPRLCFDCGGYMAPFDASPEYPHGKGQTLKRARAKEI